MSGMELPVVNRVDWLVVGGSSAGVSAAVALAGAGQAVMLVGPRSYVGEDIAGCFRFWERSRGGDDSPLAKQLFGEDQPPTPMRVKLAMEGALLDAGVSVLLTAHPAGLVCDAEGRACGVVLANRAGRQVVLAGGVIDASVEGTLCRIAGHEVDRPTGMQTVTHVTLCHDEGEDAQGLDVERLPGFAGTIGKIGYRLSARRYRLTVDFGDGSPDALLRAQAEVTRRCWVPQEYLHQEQVVCAMPDSDAGSEAALTWPAHRFGIAPGLFSLSPASATTRRAAAMLQRPVSAMNLGRQVGTALAWQNPAAPTDTSGLQVRGANEQPVEVGEVRTLNHALRSSAAAQQHVACDTLRVPRLGRYDVLVLGGGTAGAPAAIAAAQAGVSVGLIEAGPALGGVGTLGQITHYWFGNRVGFTKTIDEGVRSLEYRESFQHDKGGWSVPAKQAWYQQRCCELGVAVWLRTNGVGVWIEGDRVRGVVVAGPMGYGLIEADAVIDSTGCADLPAAAGAKTVTMGADHAAVQGTGLAGMVPARDYQNSDHNFCDDTDVAGTTAFFLSSRRKYAGHFDLGQLVDSRERRQIVGKLSLDPVDILFQRRFPDTICVATSNFDSHGYTTHPLFLLKSPDKKPLWADVPFRCLVPEGLRGLLVTGLAVSAHRDALPVIRMQADVQNQGYAAGYAAAMASAAKVDVTEVDVASLQRHLVDIGGLPPRVLTDEDSFPVDDAQFDRVVADGAEDFAGLALLFAEPQRSRPRLREALQHATDPMLRERYALLLALLGDDGGVSTVSDMVCGQAWDHGWNYRGMGQFGMSVSPVDTAIMALGGVGGADAWPALFEKVQSLYELGQREEALPDFSHCRALAVAFETLYARHPDRRAAEVLARLLGLTAMAGHAQPTVAHTLDAITDDPNENAVRNRALRELYLARAVMRCGDHEGLGRRTLESYAQDLRGHFASHARANLDRSDRISSGVKRADAVASAR